MCFNFCNHGKNGFWKDKRLSITYSRVCCCQYSRLFIDLSYVGVHSLTCNSVILVMWGLIPRRVTVIRRVPIRWFSTEKVRREQQAHERSMYRFARKDGQQHFIFIGGKGGVGKTTTSAALSLRLAQEGLRTLCVSTDPAHSLGDVLGKKLGAQPVQIECN